jgi:hypothetical protein
MPKGVHTTSASNLPPIDEKEKNKQKGTAVEGDKKILVDLSNPDKKL